jgi:hypothetical protein
MVVSDSKGLPHHERFENGHLSNGGLCDTENLLQSCCRLVASSAHEVPQMVHLPQPNYVGDVMHLLRAASVPGPF